MYNSDVTKKHFNGGIQPGMIATDAEARLLDGQCKDVKKHVYEALRALYPDIRFQDKLLQKQIPGNVGGCAPDGGVWFYGDVLIAAFEGKKQQNAGNAIERWFKNNHICRAINPNASYVTFCSGAGACEQGVIRKILNVAHLNGFNQYHPGQNSAFLKPSGFTEQEIYDIMVKTLTERITYHIKHEHK